jgi:hypothetical protein
MADRGISLLRKAKQELESKNSCTLRGEQEIINDTAFW